MYNLGYPGEKGVPGMVGQPGPQGFMGTPGLKVSTFVFLALRNVNKRITYFIFLF